MKIGLVNLDTSHPLAWLPLVRALGHEIAGVYDDGSVHPSAYAGDFARRHGIPRVFGDLEEMAGAVDCAFLHACDWDRHVGAAEPFVRAGRSVLVDKPLAGNHADLEKLRTWIDAGARITGGSALRFAREITDWRARPVHLRGDAHTVFCGCGVDGFNYGIHAFTMACAILGPGARAVRHLGDGPQACFEVVWNDGRRALVAVGGDSDEWLPFYATLVTDRTVIHLQPDPALLYQKFLARVLPWLARETDLAPCATDELLAPEFLALAGRQSRAEGGATISPDDRTTSPAFDGGAFVRLYRGNKYGT
ncbi:MAG: Gfo/Idh/MocA family oxidoreductase [Opitutaceae bacterium]|jgi:hypothetical protein